MKKTFVMLMFAVAANMASAENSVTVQRKVLNPGTADFVSINLNNESPCAGVSYEMHLPKGITFFSEATVAQTSGSSRVSYYSEEEFDDVTCLTQIQKSIFTDTDGHQYGIVASAGGFDILGTSGQLFRCRLQVASDMEPGVYPIVFKDLFYSDATTTHQINLKDRTYTSYIVIGNPANAELALEGEVGSEINAALATETAISKLDLTDVTASYGTFTYVDGREVVAPATDVTANVAYKRSVATGSYASVCLPFDATLSCYTYSETSGDYAIFNSATSLNAGTSAVVQGEINVTAENVKLGAATKETKSNGYYLKDGSFCKVNGTATIPALRGWWDLDTPSSNLRLMIDGTLTDINLLDVDAAEADAYDLQGRRSASAKNGVYVVNGKKQLVK